MADNKQIAQDVLAGVGGKENVKSVIHCATRLRFTLVDDSIPVDEDVKGIKGVLGVMKQGGMYQVIIGPTVPDVYGELTKLGVSAGGAIDENLDGNKESDKLTPAAIANKVVDYISGSVTPLIPVLISGALFRTLAAVFGPTMLNLLPADGNFITLCNMMSNAAFYFMPILVGFAAANKLGMNGYMGAFMGAALLEPSFVELASTEGASFTVFGIPAPLQNYGSSLLPILLCIAVMAPINKLVTKVLPAQIRTVFAPFITMLIMLPLGFCVLGPAGTYMGEGLALFLGWLAGTPFGWLATTLIAAFWGVLVLSGMHLGLAAIALAQYAQTGTDTCILLGANIQAWAASGAMLALCFRMRDPEKRAEFWGYFITQFFGGVGEPMLFGCFIPYRRPFICGLIGAGASGLIASILRVVLYTPIQGFAVPLSYIGGDNPMNEIFGVIAMVAGAVVAFVLAWIWGLTEAERNGAEPGTK